MMVRLLLEKDPSMDLVVYDADGGNAISVADAGGHDKIVDLLIAHGRPMGKMSDLFDLLEEPRRIAVKRRLGMI